MCDENDYIHVKRNLIEDEAWIKSVGQKVNDFFATATDADIEQLLIDSNFEYCNTVQNVGILNV